MTTQVEGTLNSRPITYINCEISEGPLTPSHLVIGRLISTLPHPDEISNDEDAKLVVRRLISFIATFLEPSRRIEVGEVALVKEDTIAS